MIKQKNIFEYIEKTEVFEPIKDMAESLNPIKMGRIKLEVGQAIYFQVLDKYTNTLKTDKGNISLLSGYIKEPNNIKSRLLDIMPKIEVGDFVYLNRLQNKISKITGNEMHMFNCEIFKDNTIQEKIINKQIQNSIDFGINEFESESSLY